jgi:tetratricopeptide (TPR) repeat protein
VVHLGFCCSRIEAKKICLSNILDLDKADLFRTPQNLPFALLDGLTDAYAHNVDDVTLVKYLEELTAALVHKNDYEAALQVHQRWSQLRRTKAGPPDKYVQLVDEYIFGVCYFGHGEYAKAQEYCDRALPLSAETRIDKTRLACLHLAALLEPRKGNFSLAIQHLCEAGLLAYAEDSNVQYQKPGSIMPLLFGVGMYALGLHEDDDVVPKSKQLILVAMNGQLQYPTELSEEDQGRARRRPSEVLKELFAAATETLGPLKACNFLKQESTSLNTFIKGDLWQDIEWVKLEHLLIEETRDIQPPTRSLTTFSHEADNTEREENQRGLQRVLTDPIKPVQRTNTL